MGDASLEDGGDAGLRWGGEAYVGVRGEGISNLGWDAGVVGVFEGIGWSGNADVVVC